MSIPWPPRNIWVQRSATKWKEKEKTSLTADDKAAKSFLCLIFFIQKELELRALVSQQHESPQDTLCALHTQGLRATHQYTRAIVCKDIMKTFHLALPFSVWPCQTKGKHAVYPESSNYPDWSLTVCFYQSMLQKWKAKGWDAFQYWCLCKIKQWVCHIKTEKEQMFLMCLSF